MKIFNYQKELNKKSVVATFSLFIPALQMTIHKMKWIKSARGGHFVQFPQYGIKDATGKWTNFPFIEISENRRKDFMEQCREELRQFVPERMEEE